MAEKRKKASGRETMQTATATDRWKARMAAARASLPEGAGQQTVIAEVVIILPSIDSLVYKSRWHNAWTMRSADPEITLAIEEVAKKLNKKKG